MAGDWIKMRVDLHTDPAVMRMADVLGADSYQVVGWLYAAWVWADTHADRHGHVTLVSRSCLDTVTGRAGFGEAMESVGWLASEPGDGAGITFPKFDRHMGEGAKERQKAAERKRKQRVRAAAAGHAPVTEMSRPGHADVTPVSRPGHEKVTLREEKRREEKKGEDKTPLPPVPGGVEGVDGDGCLPIDTNLWREFSAAWTAARLPGGGQIQRTGNRVGHLQQRLADDGWRARWREAVARAGRSAACRGEDPKFFTHGLRLDTFLKDPDMLVRILEGEFDDKPAGPPVDRRELERRAIIEDAKRKAG